MKEKANETRPAGDLYTSTLFTGRRRFVERSCDEWWILSAAHGLVHPGTPLAPYDVTLKNAGRAARRTWAQAVLASIDVQIRPQAGDVFEVHAGAEYRDFGLVEGLRTRACSVEIPAEGLSFGEQLHFYTRNTA